MRPLKVLHIEDSEEDAILFTRACAAAELSIEFYRVADGFEAMAYLKGADKFTDRSRFPFPDLIVLDLRLPGMGGFDLLKWLRRELELKSLPILVFAASDSAEDKALALAEGATAYFTKPKDFQTLVRIAESFKKLNLNGHDKNDDAT